MAKTNRGLPADFQLNVPDAVDKPVEIGDYLDEVDRPAPRVPKPQPIPKRAEESTVIEMPRPEAREPSPALPAAREPAETKEIPKRRRKIKGPARKQINATPDTLRMIEELIDHVQTYSVQKDAKASEVFHALVLALYEARDHLDLSEVEPRGRWGSPTAKAFPISMKNAFQHAISIAHKKNRR